MKANGLMNQNTEYAEYQDIRQNTAEHGRTPLYGGMLFAVLLVALLLISAPASAQTPTVTPLPGPVATATAAAVQMTQAQQAKAQAAQQAAQAQQQAAAADAQFNAAQQAANEARAALAAAASEALGRAEAAIANGKEQIGSLAGAVDGLRMTINQQADRIVALSADAQQARLEAQQLRVDKQVILQNYTAIQSRLDEQQASLSINPTTAAIVGIVALSIVLLFVAWKWSRREPAQPQSAPTDPPAAPPIDSEWQDVTNEGQHDRSH